MWYVCEHCRCVKGAVCAALYDLEEGKVYSLNPDGREVLERGLQGESLSEKELEYFAHLKALGLVTQTPVPLPEDETVSPRLDYVWLELTAQCNLHCIHCYGAFGSAPPPSSGGAMTVPDWRLVIDRVRDLGCSSVQLIGGEPLAFSGFEEVLDYANDSGMKRIDIFTNATLLNERIVEKIGRVGASVRVSLYGHNDQVHDGVTQRRGSFRQAETALRLLKSAGVRTSVAVIIMRQNENCVQGIREYVESLGHRYNGYDTIRPNRPVLKSHLVTSEDVLRPRYNTEPDFKTSRSSYFAYKCWNSCWFGKAAITATGDVIPCIFAREDIVGNVKCDDFGVISDGLVRKWSITKDNVEVCRDCEYRYACHDCRPLALGVTGSAQGKYPRCCYDPYTGRWNSVALVTQELAGSF